MSSAYFEKKKEKKQDQNNLIDRNMYCTKCNFELKFIARSENYFYNVKQTTNEHNVNSSQ